MAGLRAFLYIQRNLVKAKTNPMWKDYLRRKGLDTGVEQDYILLQDAISEYKVNPKQSLYDKYEINKPTESDIARLAAHVGLKLPEDNSKK